jgi:raffinose/stachyose/melibiose transport system substrate-binding protein
MTLSIDRHRRRRAVAVALPLAAGMLLAACGSGDSGSSGGKEPQTITISYASANSSEQAYETLAKDYEAAHPGVTVKTNRVSIDAINQTLSTQLQAGNGPDVFWVNSGTGQAASIGQFAKAGLLLPLTDASFKSDIPAAELDGYSYKGQLYGVPSQTTISGIVYNDDLAKSNGVTITADSTLQDVLSQCPTVTGKGNSIFGLAGSSTQNSGILAMQIATSTVYGPEPDWNQQRADGKTTFAKTKGWKQALQAIVDLNKAGCFQPGAPGAGLDALTNGATQGTLYGIFAPSAAAASIMAAAGGHVNLVALGFPAPEGTKPYLAVTSNVGLAGNAKTKSPKLVEDFIKFSVSKEEAKKFADSQGGIPIGDIQTSDLLPLYQPVAQMLEDKQYRPYGADGWPNGQVYDALGTGVTGLLTGQQTVDDVLKSMDAAWGS